MLLSDELARRTAIEVSSPEEILGLATGLDILAVDDHPANLVAYEAALEPLGRNVILARSGSEALEALRTRDFALLLVDVGMPTMNGIELARRVRELPRCKALPIVFITGMSPTTELVLEAYDAGAFDFLMKPILPEVLRVKVRVFLQLQERTRELLAYRRADEALVIARRLEKLQEATAGLAEALTPGEVAEITVRLGAEAVDATSAVLWLAAPDGSLAVASSHRVPDEYLAPFRTIPRDSSLPALRVLQTGQALWVETEGDYEREVPQVIGQARRGARVRAFATIPLLRQGRGIGVVTFSYDGPHHFTTEERGFLRALTHTCEQALERARLHVVEIDARHAAEATSRRKDELLAMLGHELRNPLSVIVTAIELLKLREQPPGRELTMIERHVAHMTRMVNTLVDVSRLTRGLVTLQPSAQRVADAVAHALEAAGALVASRSHQVTVRVPDTLQVHADPARLVQVLTNLVLNAAQYTPDRGEIEIAAELDGAHAKIVVRDNGRGIAADLVPRLFDVFVQGERTVDRQEGGLGVGLTVVRSIVEMHRGTVHAHSDGPGAGSTFTLRWPLAAT